MEALGTYSNFSGENGVKRVTTRPRFPRGMINPCNLLSADPETDTKNPLIQQIFRALTHPFWIPFASLIHPSENHFLQCATLPSKMLLHYFPSFLIPSDLIRDDYSSPVLTMSFFLPFLLFFLFFYFFKIKVKVDDR